jgi:hypothetical protein
MASQPSRQRPCATERVSAVTALGLGLALILLVFAVPALGGTLGTVSWTVSNSQVGTSAVTYSFAFTTATAGHVGAVTIGVPADTVGTPIVGAVYGLGAGKVSLAAGTLTYALATPTIVPAGVPVYLSFGGLTNSMAAGCHASTVTVRTPQGTVIDAGSSQAIAFGASSTSLCVTVGATLAVAGEDLTGLPHGDARPAVRSNGPTGYSLTVVGAAPAPAPQVAPSGHGLLREALVSVGATRALAFIVTPRY